MPVAGGHKDQKYKTEEHKIREGHGKEWGEEEWRKGKSGGEGNIVRSAINSMFDSKWLCMGAGTWQFHIEVVNNSLNSAEPLTTHMQTTKMNPTSYQLTQDKLYPNHYIWISETIKLLEENRESWQSCIRQ